MTLVAAAGERQQRGKETGRLSSRNPPAADTAALTDAREHRHPGEEHTHDYHHSNEVNSAAGGVHVPIRTHDGVLCKSILSCQPNTISR